MKKIFLVLTLFLLNSTYTHSAVIMGSAYGMSTACGETIGTVINDPEVGDLLYGQVTNRKYKEYFRMIVSVDSYCLDKKIIRISIGRRGNDTIKKGDKIKLKISKFSGTLRDDEKNTIEYIDKITVEYIQHIKNE